MKEKEKLWAKKSQDTQKKKTLYRFMNPKAMMLHVVTRNLECLFLL